MKTSDLRIALFSGNYNYVRDGANQALNRLVEYLLRQGAQVRIYSPTTDTPAFEPTGDLVSLPSVPIPTRSEYRLSTGVNSRIRRDLAAFNPNVVHVSAPDISGHRAISWARRRGIAAMASVHTRFETYFRYYNMAWIEPLIEAILRRFYRRCDALVAPSESFAQVLRDQRMNYDIDIWSIAMCSIQNAAIWPGADRWGSLTTNSSSGSSAGWSWKRGSTSFPMRSTNCAAAAWPTGC
jgi:phosphatidylinositol alpha 1,6-mannosyltransferase